VSGSYHPWRLSLSIPEAVAIYRTLDSAAAGFELNDYELDAWERFRFHVEQVTGAKHGKVGKPRTGFVPAKEAGVGPDDSHRHCVCCRYQPDH